MNVIDSNVLRSGTRGRKTAASFPHPASGNEADHPPAGPVKGCHDLTRRRPRAVADFPNPALSVAGVLLGKMDVDWLYGLMT
ncbi:hypothetical protein [Nitrobacter sp.]|jgi:hypothetical protein|uniref:hypothetical protein n=1 Tax=Nitrobacter sp. TaxID=29420 RepID=UPI0029CAB595|nr:hypothetical protein [Nitrobacter sp.]